MRAKVRGPVMQFAMWINRHPWEIRERSAQSARSDRFVDERILGPELPENGYLVDTGFVGDSARGGPPVSMLGVHPGGGPQQFFSSFHDRGINGRAVIFASEHLLATDVYNISCQHRLLSGLSKCQPLRRSRATPKDKGCVLVSLIRALAIQRSTPFEQLSAVPEIQRRTQRRRAIVLCGISQWK